MNTKKIDKIAKQLVALKKGILAADESIDTIKKRFDSINIEATEENRRAYRELLFITPEIENYISGVILFDETIRQSTKDGIRFTKVLADKGILIGIKVDLGKEARTDSPKESLTVGLVGLKDRLKEYYELGARFAKWRAVIDVTEDLPTKQAVQENAERLAQYAKLCQEAYIVPIVEPEVLMDGPHSIVRSYEVQKMTLTIVFEELKKAGVMLQGMILKPSMVISGSDSQNQATAEQVAKMTIKCFKETVPSEIAGIVFLSGGQSEEQACENLRAINQVKEDSPWVLTFSYGRALQDSVLKVWAGKKENIVAAQGKFLERAKCCSLASQASNRQP